MNVTISTRQIGLPLWACGTVTADGHGGYGVIRRGSPRHEWMIRGLATKGEGYKILYGLSHGWTTATVKLLNGQTIRIRLQRPATERHLYGGESI